VTIVHVFLFTAAFMIYGALRTKSQSGIAALLVLIACAVATLVSSAHWQIPGARIRELYGPFEQLNAVLLQLWHRSPSNIYGSTGAGIMRFIAFAYTYHYLNWFSKTSIIGWHRAARTRIVAIATLSAAAIALYAYNYRIGFAALYALSMLHVMLEFPLNYQTFGNVVRGLLPAQRGERLVAG
jgi:hypothetical protein